MSKRNTKTKRVQEQSSFDRVVSFLRTFFSIRHVRRDMLFLTMIILLISVSIISKEYLKPDISETREPATLVAYSEPKKEKVVDPNAPITFVDTSDWHAYASKWYGFTVRYPQTWQKPAYRKALSGSKWEYRYEFRKDAADKSGFRGFDVIVYDTSRVRSFTAMDEFPVHLGEINKNDPVCQSLSGSLVDNENIAMEEIRVDENDICYEQAFFFSVTREQYIYNLVAIDSEGNVSRDYKRIRRSFEELFSIAGTFDFIDIQRPKPQVAKKITAPMPVWFAIRDGKRVCAKKNDKPGNSSKTSKKHLDMECCLDPDEYPNPHCFYSPEKYGRYLP